MFEGARYAASFRNVRNATRAVETLRAQTASIENQVSVLDGLRRDVDTATAQMRLSASQLALLAELQSLVPEETVLHRYVIHKNVLSLTGLCPRSADLVARLNASKMFTGIKFNAPIEKDPNSGKEKFSLEMTVGR
jgi:hypothetical protein